MVDFLRTLLRALALSAFCGSAWAALLSGPDCARPLTVGLHVHGLLYSAQSGTGIDKDMVDALEQRSGCTLHTSVLPRARIWQLIESGAMDFSLSGISSGEREKFAAFAWYFSNKYYLLARKDQAVERLADFEARPRLQLGLIRGFRFGPRANAWVDRLTEKGRVSYASDLEPLYRVLSLGRIHGMIIEPFDMMDVQGTPVKDVTRIIEMDDPSVPHGLIMSKKSITEAERAKWQALVDALRQDGTVLRIFEKYFPPDLARAMVDF